MIALSGRSFRTLVSLLLVAAACGKGTEPVMVVPPPFSNPAAVTAAIAAADSALAAPALQSLVLLSPLMTIRAPSAASPFGAPGRCAAHFAASQLGPFAAHGVAGFGTIPDSVRRHVFTLSAPFAAYHASADTSGPANGVRFILYQTSSTGALATPAVSIGILDLTDVGAPVFHTRITSGSATLADYDVVPWGTLSADTATLAGTLSSGLRSFAFRDTTSVNLIQLTNSTTLHGTVYDSVLGVELRVLAQVYKYDAYDGNYAFDFVFMRGGDTIRLSGNVFTFCLIATTEVAVTLNGDDFATIGDTPAGLAVSPVAGGTLTTEQSGVILALLQFQQQLYQVLAALHLPARQLLPP